jgi:hypothetical protein
MTDCPNLIRLREWKQISELGKISSGGSRN